MSDDPFGANDGDRTVLRPRPGGNRASPSRVPPRPQPPAGSASRQPPPPPPTAALGQIQGGLNPLTGAATTLIALLSQLRGSPHHSDPTGLFQQISGELQQFETTAMAKGEPQDTVLAARYVLCTALDEAVLNTPWGGRSIWANRTLLSTFHNETSGGEKFFLLLDRLLQQPAANLHLLELMYLCLALGFEGKYGMRDSGRAELDRIQEQLFQVIRSQRGDFERSLSPHWRGVRDRRSRLARYVPLWVVAAVAGGIIVLTYIGFLIAANRASEPVLADLSVIGRNLASLDSDRVQTTPAPGVDLRPYLRTEIESGRLQVSSDPRGQLVTIAGDGLFASGRANVEAQYVPLIQAIGNALDQVPGQVVVTGHTDNVPASGFGRYKTNWDLSEARAMAVLDIIASRVDPARLRAEGVGDTQPLVANDSDANRARNRRVEILLQAQAGRP